MLKETFTISIIIFFIFLPCFQFSSKSTQAAQILKSSDVMSRLKINTAANHNIKFTSLSGVGAGQTVVITFASGFNMNGIDYTDVDLKINSMEIDLATSPAGAVWGVNVSGQTITFTNGNVTVAGNAVIEIEAGKNATHQGTGDLQIINPIIPAVYLVRVSGSFGDSGSIGVIILREDQVTMSAEIAVVLTFTLEPLPTNTPLGGTNSAYTHLVAKATATSLPFGTQIINQGTVLGQRVTVSTNTGNGYLVTIAQSHDMQSGKNKIDNFPATNDSPQLWEESINPHGTVSNNNTGWLGYTTSDQVLGGANPGRFGTGPDAADYWAGFIENNAPYEVASHNGLIYNDFTNIGYKFEVNAAQPAGNYVSTITYVCTGIF